MKIFNKSKFSATNYGTELAFIIMKRGGNLKNILLASHGKLASGILSSLELIYGKIDNVSTLDCYLTNDFDLSQEIANIMELNKDNELIVVTDIFGGSVNNEFLSYINQKNIFIIAGLNLPFLIEFLAIKENHSTYDAIKEALVNSKELIQFCNETFNRELNEEDF